MDQEKRLCKGCFTQIAPFDRDALKIGAKWFHSRGCHQRMLDRKYLVYLKYLKRAARKEALVA